MNIEERREMLFARLWRKVFYKIINTVICNFKDCRLEFIFIFQLTIKYVAKYKTARVIHIPDLRGFIWKREGNLLQGK